MLWCRRQRGHDCLGGTRGGLDPLDNQPVRIKLTGTCLMRLSLQRNPRWLGARCSKWLKNVCAEVRKCWMINQQSSDVIMEGSVRNTLKVSIEEYGVDIINRLAAGLELGIVVVESISSSTAATPGEVAKATVVTGGAAAAGGAWLPAMALARLATTARKRVRLFGAREVLTGYVGRPLS
eukprot:CCRYP_010229-RA/>CCRYP_010229-RA protein AED:0.41 eAED:0.56 QI:0/0.25/0.2/1/0/0/5/127/179